MGEVHSFGDTVVTPHALATSAGLEALAAGGNAADAAIAADAVLGVVAPETCGIGGDLFALVHTPGDLMPATLNASGRAGEGADPDELRGAGHEVMPPYHPLTVTIPGCVDGWEALHGRFGALPMPQVLAPAIRLAEMGFPASAELAASLAVHESVLMGQPSAAALYPAGRPPAVGQRLRRPDLAQTLQEFVDGGRESFYQGRPGRAITAAVGGRITASDLQGSQAEWITPAGLDVFGLTAWTVPPNSQGYLTLTAAWFFEQLAPPRDPSRPEFVHSQIEAYRAVAWERDLLVADPSFAPLAPLVLVDPDRLAPRLAAMSMDRAAFWPKPAPVPGGTAYLCTVDRHEMGVSFIQSNFMGIGSRIGCGETGFFLHNRGAGFSLEPGHPNELAPGKRPLHTLSPSLWTSDGRLAMLLGTRGGHLQPQLLLQLATRILYAGETLGDAQAAPRFCIDEFGPGVESLILIESTTAGEMIEELSRRGHRVEQTGPRMSGWGPVSVVAIREDGLRIAAADPRVATASAGVR